MTLLALPLALVLPTLFGWLMLRLLEGKQSVLFQFERWVMGLFLGLTAILFVQFFAQAFGGIPFSLWGLLGVQGISTAVLAIVWFFKRLPAHSPALPPSPPLSPTARLIFGILLTWASAKALLLAVTFLILTPSYLQDTLTNWNLRGKVQYETQALTLVMPNEDPTISPRGVSSYPPTVPMAKVLIANMAGEWNEAPVNAIHFMWYLSAIAMLYFAIRRHASRGWALLGVYILMSLPLYLLHGTNPYADAFVSAHVFAAVSLLFHASQQKEEAAAASFVRLAAFAGSLLVFTKNEGLLVFFPPLMLCLLLTLWHLNAKHVLSMRRIIRLLLGTALCVACVAGPWLMFKWMNGLTFGNAKPFTSLGFGWQENVVFAIVVNTFSEGNWLLLFSLFFLLLGWQWRTVRGLLLIPATFFLVTYIGQALLYLFTSLSREALMQTGYARGLIHLAPVIVLLTVFLLRSALTRYPEWHGFVRSVPRSPSAH